jgi:hypothetical protein
LAAIPLLVGVTWSALIAIDAALEAVGTAENLKGEKILA